MSEQEEGQKQVAIDFSRVEGARQSIIRHFNGLLTLCYPEGMDILYFESLQPLRAIEKLSQAIGEPVQLAINFGHDMGNTFFMRMPSKVGAEETPGWLVLKELPSPPEGGWMQALSLSSQTLPPKKDVDFQLIFSGASWRDPVMVVDFGTNNAVTLPTAKQRVEHFARLTGIDVCAQIGDQVIVTNADSSQRYMAPFRQTGQRPDSGLALAMLSRA